MKKFVWLLGIVFLALTVLVVSCAKAPPAEQPAAEQPQVSTTEGTLGEVDVEKSTVTVETPQGPKTFSITPSTKLTLEANACSLDQLEALNVSGENFGCTVVYDDEGNVLSLDVYRIAPPASVKGTISDVNIKESTITVKTAEGDKVFEVDQETGLLVDGVACSLELVDALVEASKSDPIPYPINCTVIVSTDEEGKALYFDIANPPGFTTGTGTLTDVGIEKSTVTITLDTGEQRTFEVNAETGHFLNGEVCSLDDLLAATEHNLAYVGGCQVMYHLDKDGNLVYLDVTHTVTP